MKEKRISKSIISGIILVLLILFICYKDNIFNKEDEVVTKVEESVEENKILTVSHYDYFNIKTCSSNLFDENDIISSNAKLVSDSIILNFDNTFTYKKYDCTTNNYVSVEGTYKDVTSIDANGFQKVNVELTVSDAEKYIFNIGDTYLSNELVTFSRDVSSLYDYYSNDFKLYKYKDISGIYQTIKTEENTKRKLLLTDDGLLAYAIYKDSGNEYGFGRYFIKDNKIYTDTTINNISNADITIITNNTLTIGNITLMKVE